MLTPRRDAMRMAAMRRRRCHADADTLSYAIDMSFADATPRLSLTLRAPYATMRHVYAAILR